MQYSFDFIHTVIYIFFSNWQINSGKLGLKLWIDGSCIPFVNYFEFTIDLKSYDECVRLFKIWWVNYFLVFECVQCYMNVIVFFFKCKYLWSSMIGHYIDYENLNTFKLRVTFKKTGCVVASEWNKPRRVLWIGDTKI